MAGWSLVHESGTLHVVCDSKQKNTHLTQNGSSLTCAHTHASLAPRCIFLGDMGGDLKTSQKKGSYLKENKQPFRVYLFRGHGGDLGHGVGLGT